MLQWFLSIYKNLNIFNTSHALKILYECLEAFYAVNAPEKANDEHIEKIMKKWAGKEERLFDKLEKKYEQVRKREEAMKQDEREHGNGEDE